MAAINGKDIMIFFKFPGAQTPVALAMATNHVLNLTTETEETSSKDSGIWGDQEVTKLRWSVTSDNFVEGIEADDAFGKLFAAWKAGEKVDVVLAIPTNITNGSVPEGGWLPPSTGGGYKGKATIDSLTLNAPNGQKSNFSASLTGAGELEALPTE